jgi:ribose transport system substrate-binding protein
MTSSCRPAGSAPLLGVEVALSKQTVVVALLSQDQEFQRLQAEDARVPLRQRLKTEVVFAEDSAIIQIQQLYKFVHRPPASARSRSWWRRSRARAGAGRRAAVQAGIGWLIVNRRVPYLDTLRKEYPRCPSAPSRTEQVEVGRIQARQILALLPHGQRNVLYVRGRRHLGREGAAAGRERGAPGVERPAPAARGPVDEASGQHVVERWLRMNPSEEARPALVACQNDAMALGARRALRARRDIPALAQVPVTGVDAWCRAAARRSTRASWPPRRHALERAPALHLIAQFVATGAPARADGAEARVVSDGGRAHRPHRQAAAASRRRVRFHAVLAGDFRVRYAPTLARGVKAWRNASDETPGTSSS